MMHSRYLKIYLSDEGYGHIVRQRAILEELMKLDPHIHATVQTERHFDFAKANLDAQDFVNKFNNIIWYKNHDGSPDLDRIRSYYDGYINRVSTFMRQEQVEKFDFLITDFVYEAFELAGQARIPVFGVSHFTWDWFLDKLYPRVISDSLFKYFTQQALRADKLFFPPLTPSDLLHHYRRNAQEVPFIIRSEVNHQDWPDASKFKVLIMDSGAGLMKNSIRKALESLHSTEVEFGVLDHLADNNEDVFRIPSHHLLVDYVQGADLVVGRPGFNTLSECIAYRVPMLLISESMNPEMDHNISQLKKQRLGAFMTKEDFETRFDKYLAAFLRNEYTNLRSCMDGHTFETNGAKVIAKEILNRI